MRPFFFFAVICLSLLTQCATETPQEPKGSFSVKVVPFFGKDVRVYIQAYERVNGQRGPALDSSRVTGDGVTGFVLPLGRTYGVSAYADVDGDGKKGPADPSASIEGLQPVADVNRQQAPGVLTLPGTGLSQDWPHKTTGDTGPPPEADLQKGLDEVREAAPQLPIPPPPVPPPPR